jgi:hypothetical protein
MSALHIEDIRARYNIGYYTASYHLNTTEKLSKLPEDYIFDEDLSVKRNREMVAEHNEKVVQQQTFKREKQLELDKQLTEDVIEYITDSYNLTLKQAKLVEQWVYKNYHSCMCDYFSYIDDAAEFADTLVNQGEVE